MKHLHSRTPSLIEPLEARIAPAVDLLLKITSIEFPNVAVPGNSGTITMTIENIGDEVAKNTTDINIWLVPDPGAGQQPGDSVYNGGNFGRNTAKSMKIVEGEKDVPLNLKPVSEGGTPKIVTKKFTLPDLILGEGTVAPGDLYFTNDPGGPSVYHPFNMTPGLHYIVAEVDGGNENEPFFLSHQNNFAAPAGPFDYQYQFGTVGSRSNVDLHVTSGTFDTTTRTFTGPSADFSLSGPGKGTISVVNATAGVPTNRNNLAFTGTSAASFAAAGVFKNKAGLDRFTLNNITADAAMKGIKLPKFDLTGNVDINNGGIAGLELGNVGGSGKHINIGGAAADPPATVILGRVNDLDLTSNVGLDVLQVIDWRKGGAADTIMAPFISDLSTKGDSKAAIAGDFAATINLNGANAKGFALGEVTVVGQLQQTTFTATGTGKVGDIVAKSANQWGLNIQGAADDIVILQDLAGATPTGLTAKSFSSIKVGGNLSNHITATGADDKGIGIKNVVAKAIQAINIKAENGGIEKVEAGDWTGGGELKAKTVKTLTTKTGDFTPTLNLTGISIIDALIPSIGTATIAGALKTGTWNIKGKIQSLTAGSVEAGWSLLGETTDAAKVTRIEKLMVKGAVAGSFTAWLFDKVEFKGDFTGSIKTETSESRSFGSFTAAKVIGATFNASGAVGKFSVDQWSGGSITALDFGDLSFTGAKGVSGDLKNTTLKITGTGTFNGFGKLTAKGSLATLIIDAAQAYLGTITAKEWIGGSLTAQALLNLDLNGDKAASIRGDLSGVTIKLFDPVSKLTKTDVAGFIENATIETQGKLGLVQALGMNGATIKALSGEIDKVIIKGKEAGVDFFIASNVTAEHIDTVFVSNVKTTNGGTAFGFSATTIDKYLRKIGGAVVESAVGLDPSKSPFDADDDYRVLLPA